VGQTWNESELATPPAARTRGSEGRRGRAAPKVWVILSAALIGGMAVGVAIGAAGFSNQNVNHNANAYSTTFQGLTAFQGGAATVAAGFSTHSGCTSGPVALGASLTPIYIGVASSTVCTSSDFGETFTIPTNTSGQLASPHTVVFSFQSTYGTGPTVSVNSITVTTSSTTAASTSLVIFVDFGTSWLPAGGISGFNVIAAQTQ
jgi:hypothetical protein